MDGLLIYHTCKLLGIIPSVWYGFGTIYYFTLVSIANVRALKRDMVRSTAVFF